MTRRREAPMATEPGPSTPVRATRLIFEYEGGVVRLVLRQSVEVAAGHLRTATLDQPGVFVDVRDAANRTLARVPAGDALATSVEVFPERHDEPIVRTDVVEAKGSFSVLVPTPDASDHATVVRVTAPTRSGAGPAAIPDTIDLESFPLRVDR